MQSEFTGKTQALSTAGIDTAAGSLSVSPAEIWTVMAVETSGCGFLPDRRPQILYERHIFHRLTAGRFDDGDISDPSPGNYGPGGAHQYDRLTTAIALDRAAALRSTSWGLGQIMGENAAKAGFADVETMVIAMVDSEDAQLEAMTTFIGKGKLGTALASHNWAAFAAGYNGPNFAKNQYDQKLAAAFDNFSQGSLPDLTIRAAQLYLTFAGFNPGPIDGRAGQRTRNAIISFQSRNQLPQTGSADEKLLTALRSLSAP